MTSLTTDRQTDPVPTIDTAVRTTAELTQMGLVAVLRAQSVEHLPAVAERLVETGIRIIEVTLTAPGALTSVAQLTTSLGEDAIVGAGTVMTADQAEASIDAGAAFLVSPTASPDVIAAGRIAGIATYPGALTPTEIMAAYRSGASAVKLFPASAVSPRFIIDLHAPCPDVPIIPAGGIAIDEIANWLRAGAAAVGLGSQLIGAALTDGPDHALIERARRALAAVANARGRE